MNLDINTNEGGTPLGATFDAFFTKAASQGRVAEVERETWRALFQADQDAASDAILARRPAKPGRAGSGITKDMALDYLRQTGVMKFSEDPRGGRSWERHAR